MRYLFTLAAIGGAGIEAEADITNKRETRLVDDEAPGGKKGVLRPWVYADFGDNKPTKAYIVDVINPVIKGTLPENEDDHTIDMWAWKGLLETGIARDVVVIEWPDGSIELSLPEHDDTGTEGKPIKT